MAIQAQPRPVPENVDQLSLSELLALRFWPPTRNRQQIKLAQMDGRHMSRARGRGMEFDDVRLYQAGDDVRHLDWRLLARTGDAYSRLYRQERERPVYLFTDLGPTMQFASRGHLKSLLAAYAAALVAWSVQQRGDRIGGQVFTPSQGAALFKPKHSKQAVSGLLNALSDGVGDSAETVLADGYLRQALIEQSGRISTGSQCYILSDFRQLDEALVDHLQRLAQRCELHLVMISDPLERELPLGADYWFTADNLGRSAKLSDSASLDAYRNLFDARVATLSELARFPAISSYQWRTDHHPLFDVNAEVV